MAEEPQQQPISAAQSWLKWLMLWLPLMVVATGAMSFVGFPVVMAALLLLLAATLAYQRYVNRRSWNSILWGRHAKDV